MKIEQVRIIIEPWEYANPTRNVLRIRIKKAPGAELFLEKVLPDDDLYSLWDHIWRYAGEELKRAMGEEQNG